MFTRKPLFYLLQLVYSLYFMLKKTFYDFIQEDELLSMIEKCEAEEGTLPQKNSKQLRSMPSVLTSLRKTSSSCSSSSSDNSENDDYNDVRF